MNSAEKVSFDSVCPAGHKVEKLEFSKEELSSMLADGSLRLWCFTCYEDWQPNEEEKRRIKDWLETQ